MNHPPVSDIPEADLAHSIGISRADLKKMRGSLSYAEHWRGGGGAPIVFTAAGIAALETLLSAKKTPDGALQEAASAARRGDPYETLVVVKIGSERVLLAKKEGVPDPVPAAELVRVQVRTALHFVPGMTLAKCARSPHHPSVAYYHGRYPRRRGKF